MFIVSTRWVELKRERFCSECIVCLVLPLFFLVTQAVIFQPTHLGLHLPIWKSAGLVQDPHGQGVCSRAGACAPRRCAARIDQFEKQASYPAGLRRIRLVLGKVSYSETVCTWYPLGKINLTR